MSTSARPRRRGHPLRTTVTLVIVAALLVSALVVSLGYVQGWLGKHPPTAKACVPTTVVRPAQVTLNVYNATSRAGLARKTADSLRKRGFKIASVANDPLEKKVTGTSEVRYGTAGARAAKLVAQQVKGARMVRDTRSDATLDIVVGNKFHTLAKPVKVSTKATSKATTKGSASATGSGC